MTVKELKEQIKDLPDGMEVFIQAEAGQILEELTHEKLGVCNGNLYISDYE